MAACLNTCPAVEDAVVDLIEAANRLIHIRSETARVASQLEARWAANRALSTKADVDGRIEIPEREM